MTSWRGVLLAAPAVLLLVVFLGAPYVDMVVMSLHNPGHGDVFGAGFTFANYGRALSEPVYLAALGRSLALGVVVTACCLVLAYPVALHLAKAGRRLHLLGYAIIVSPLLLGVLVRNFGWLIVLSPQGPLNQAARALGLIDRPWKLLFTQGAVTLALVHVFLPFMVLPIASALRAVPGSLLEASDSLGGGRWRGFWHVTLPLSFPGVQAGVILVFVLSTSAYVTPALIGGQGTTLMPLLMVQELLGAFAWPFGGALALVLAASLLLVVGRVHLGDGAVGGEDGAMKWLAAFVLAAIYGFVLLPLVVVVLCAFTAGELMQFPPQGLSLRWFARFWADDGFVQALMLSVRVALVTTVAVTVLGTLAALGRRAMSAGARRWLQLGMMLPLLLPELLTAIGLLFFLYPIGLGKTLLGLQIAHIVVTLPFAFIAICAALDQVDPALEEASASLGGSEWQTLWHVLRPLAKAGMMSGALLAFVTSFDMFTVSFLLKPVGGNTLPLALFDYLTYDFDPTAAAAATISVALAVVGVVVIERTVGLRTL